MALFTGTYLIDVDETASTNNYALNLLKQKQVFEGTTVRTFKQSDGRGQRHKHWESEDFKNLTFSIIYYPVFLSVSLQFQLSKAIGLGIADYIKEIIKSEPVKIKWPNDIYVGNKKIAGVLIENSVSGNKISSSVIGIGININQTIFSTEIPNPVSLKQISNQDFDLGKSFEQLCLFIEARYMQLKFGRSSEINSDYMKLLYLLNQPSHFNIGGKMQTAEIIGVNEQGKLKLKTASELIECGFHEVAYLI